MPPKPMPENKGKTTLQFWGEGLEGLTDTSAACAAAVLLISINKGTYVHH